MSANQPGPASLRIDWERINIFISIVAGIVTVVAFLQNAPILGVSFLAISIAAISFLFLQTLARFSPTISAIISITMMAIVFIAGIISAPTITSVFMPKQSTKFSWDGATLSDTDFNNISYQNGSIYTFDNSSLVMSGVYLSDRVWVGEKTIPENTRIFLQVKALHPTCRFMTGFGNGLSWGPDYHFYFHSDGSAFRNFLDPSTGVNSPLIQEAANIKLQPNVLYSIVIERQGGSLRIFIDNRKAIDIGNGNQIIANINQYNKLFLSSWTDKPDSWCTTIVSNLQVTSLN